MSSSSSKVNLTYNKSKLNLHNKANDSLHIVNASSNTGAGLLGTGSKTNNTLHQDSTLLTFSPQNVSIQNKMTPSSN